MWLDTIRLAFGHSLVAGKIPPSLNIEKFAEAYRSHQKTDIAQFGLFDTASPNFSSYYPGMDASELEPKDGDFIKPVFRALSEVVVHKNWNPVDFSRNGVLKKSMSKLTGQTVYPNHEAVVGNELGSVLEVSWENETKAGDIIIPAGINAMLMIDGKSNPKIARGIMMDPPSIHSTSVTVQFLWDKSHPSMTEDEFFRKLGTYDNEGKLITKVATDVKTYREISLVSHGADPYAQKKGKDGKIVNPKFANNTYNLSAEEKKNQIFFYFDYKEELIQNSESPTIPLDSNDNEEISNNENTTFMNATLIALAAMLGVTLLKEGDNAETANLEALTGKIQELKNAQVDPAELKRLQDCETELKALKEKQSPDTTALQAHKEATTKELRDSVTKLAGIMYGNKIPEAISNMITNADFSVLKGLETQFNASVEKEHPLSCKKCGSTEVNRGSAKPEEVNNDDQGGSKEETPAGEEKLSEFVAQQRKGFVRSRTEQGK